MLRNLMHAKLHGARVTDHNLDYQGSIVIDRALMDQVGILPHERVQVVNKNNGNRFETYVFEGVRESGDICVNGAAARLVSKGDELIIIAYAHFSAEEAAAHTPKVAILSPEIVSSNSALELGAPAKLNLFLEVIGRRPDGYHEIDSVFAEIDLFDRVRVEPDDRISLTVSGEFDAPADGTNLVWQAAEALGVGARIHLEKRIPAGAGLGGGSSDAAAVLLALDQIYGLDRTEDELHDIARSLGADVPFFLEGGTARCRGIGDEVESVENPPTKRFLVVTPLFPIATAKVYAGLGPGLTENPETATFFLEQYCGRAVSDSIPYFNRLQDAAERLDPRLVGVRESAEREFGCTFTMSGSGSSYFAEIESELRGMSRLERGGPGPAHVFVAKTG